MKVAFNARLLHDPALRGWNRYTASLMTELSALGVNLLLYSDSEPHESYLSVLRPGNYAVRVSPRMKYVLWEQFWLPRQCAADRVNVLHSPFNFGLPWTSVCPRVLTLHDAIDTVYYGAKAGWREKLSREVISMRVHNWIARTRADRIITVSEHARHDLVTQLNIPAEKVSVIYEAAAACFHEPITAAERSRVRRTCGLNRRYVFYAGGWEMRKNINFLVRAFAASGLENVDLVMAGGKDPRKKEIVELAELLGISDSLRPLGWVTNEELSALYAEALCFVYPSEYEGFGLQLCEAMAVGCPVLAARNSALTEVLADGGETFSLSDTSELVQLLHKVTGDSDYRASLIDRAKARSLEFSWRRTAEQTLAIYHKLCEQ